MEDDMEVYGYDDFVPLEIKLALEEKVFGWTHLTSTVLGHVLFPLGAYLVVVSAIPWIWNYLLVDSGSDKENDNVGDHDKNYNHSRNHSNRRGCFEVIRNIWGLLLAMITYRMVRRRRRIWFRTSYGSKAYQNDSLRRSQQVQDTDRTTPLGRMVTRFLQRRVRHRLRTAETMFAKKHKQEQQQQQQQNRSKRIQQQTLSVDDDDGTKGSTSKPSSSLSSTTSEPPISILQLQSQEFAPTPIFNRMTS